MKTDLYKKHLLLVVVLSSILPLLVIGKPTNIDSFQRIINSDTHDTIRLKAMSKIGWHYFERDFNKSMKHADQILILATKLNRDVDIANAYNLMGANLDTKSEDIEEVVGFFNEAVYHLEKAGNQKKKANVLNNIGLAYRRIGDYEQAFSYNLQALKIGETIKDTVTIVLCLNNMAIIYNQTDEDEKAKSYYFKSLDLAEAIDYKRMIATINNNLANIYFEHHQNDTALILFEKSLAIKRELGNEFRLVTTLSNIGKVYINEEKYELANQYLNEAFSIAQKLDYPYGKGLCLAYLAKAALMQKEYRRAVEYAEMGINALGKDGELSLQYSLYDAASQGYENSGRPTLALEYYKTYQTLKDSIYQIERQEDINQLEVQYQVKHKDMENKLLKTEQALTKKTLRNRTLWIIGLILIVVLILGWALASYRFSQHQKKMNEALEIKVTERTQALQLANKELQQANYELKTFNHIASHDIKEPIRNIGNYASLVFRKLPSDLQVKFEDYFKIIKRSTSQLYTLIEDFAHYTTMSKDKDIDLQMIDLNMILESLEHGLQATIQQYNGRIINHGLPELYSNASLLYIVLKNLIENGLKFNQSAVPTVELSYIETEGYHDIIVQDNGIGIEGAYSDKVFEMFSRLHNRGEYAGSGIGLAIVKLLVQKLNAKIILQSQFGEGSRFTIRLPKEEVLSKKNNVG